MGWVPTALRAPLKGCVIFAHRQWSVGVLCMYNTQDLANCQENSPVCSFEGV